MTDWKHANHLSALASSMEPDPVSVARVKSRARRPTRRRWAAPVVGGFACALALGSLVILSPTSAADIVEPPVCMVETPAISLGECPADGRDWG